MSEYNIQMNKYNALNAQYDQLYPQPMKHASTHAKDGSDPILPSSIGAYSKEETDTLLQNKAPAGYGLGGQYGFDITGSTGDANNAKYNGWYTTNSDTANLPTKMPYVACKEGTILTAVRGWQVKQIFFDNIYGYVAMRLGNVNTNAWGEWEYVNPPMALGVEYRTTERYMGKAVYVKRIVLDALAIGTEAQPSRTNIDGGLFTDVCETLVRHDMFVYPSSGGAMFRIPFINAEGKLKAIGSMTQSNVSSGDTWLYGSIYTFDDLSAFKAMVTCWYTKTTD